MHGYRFITLFCGLQALYEVVFHTYIMFGFSGGALFTLLRIFTNNHVSNMITLHMLVISILNDIHVTSAIEI